MSEEDRMREALRWYAREVKALASATGSFIGPMYQVNILAKDGGKRAEAALGLRKTDKQKK